MHKGYALILSFGLIIACGIAWKYREDIKAARSNYRQEESLKSAEVAKRIEVLFQRTYEGLRTIARLPGVKTIDRHAKNFDDNAHLTVQELYNNIANEVSLSEIYIVPVDFDPDRLDPITGAPEVPTIMFDELIVGQTGGPAIRESRKVNSKIDVEEIEIYEYRLIAKQLALMKNHFPTENRFVGLNVPAYIGEEVITCDNTRFDPLEPNDENRSGLVYSVPFYSFKGKLKGCICGIVLSHVIRDHIGDGYYMLSNKSKDYLIKSHGFSRPEPSVSLFGRLQPDPDLIYSQVLSIDIVDQNGEWILWSGLPNQDFWGRNDVVMARQFALLGYATCILLTCGLVLGYFLVRRNRFRQENMVQELRRHQTIIQRFSRKILSVREEEKKSLASDLHDMVGSMAISLNASLAVTKSEIESNNMKKALESIQHAKKSIDRSVKNFKKVAVSLRPLNLETVGLASALQEFCSEITQNTSLQIELSVDVDENKIPEHHTIVLYRIVQESLNNVIKHANATKVTIKFHENDEFIVEIIDDGVGFNMDKLQNNNDEVRMGIIGMQERVESLGGTFILNSTLGKGTCITIKLKSHKDGCDELENGD